MVRVKICGIRSLKEAKWATEAGADGIGFVFVPQSKRYIRPEQAREIGLNLPPFIARVGVFVNEDPTVVAEIVQTSHLTAIQLHGTEVLDDYQNIHVPCLKAINFSVDPIINSPGVLPTFGDPLIFKQKHLLEKWKGMLQGILVDSSFQGQTGGTGSPLPWEDPSLQQLFDCLRSFDIPLILAGGLNPENVQRAIQVVKPYAVDVSSGVELGGTKQQDLIQSFIEKVKDFE